MERRCYYEVLGIQRRTANEKRIKSAYRKLAMRHHHDRNPGDEDAAAKFAEVNEAYSVLSDAVKRKLYDEGGHDAVRSAQQPDNEHAKVYGNLSQLFLATLREIDGAGQDPTEHDVLKSMRATVAKRLAEVKDNQQSVASAIAKLERLRGRFTVDGEADVFEGTLEQSIRHAGEQLEACDAEVELLGKCEAYLKQCKYKFTPPKRAQKMGGMATWTFLSGTGASG